MQSNWFKLPAFIILILKAMSLNAQAPKTTQEIKTDVVARQSIHLMNARQPDSLYAIMGEAAKANMQPAQWNAFMQNQVAPLLPFTKLSYLGSDDGVNKYKLDGKIALLFNISLDGSGKVADFLFTVYKAETKAVTMTEQEQHADVVAQKVLGYINRRQADSAYVFAGDSFKAAMDLAAWHDFTEKEIYPMLPLPKPVFVRSYKGINKYKLDAMQFTLSLDKQGKFNSFGIELYHEDAKKTVRATTNNPLKSSLDIAVDKFLGSYMQNKSSVGLNAAVHYQGKDHFYAYGETAQGNHILPIEHTLFEIGSITKTFTATLLAKAVSDGLTTLETPISKYLPDSVAINPDLKNITLKQLANHTSGLPRMPSNFDAVVTDLQQRYQNYDEAHLYAFLKTFRAVRGAGVSYEYSNIAVSLLGVILEKLYHKPYEQLIKKYIATPLLMKETKITLTAADKKHIAQGYNESVKPVPVWQFNATKAQGAILSTAADMLLYGKAQLTSAVNPLSTAIQATHRVTFDDGTNQVCLGWYLLRDKKDSIIQHNGGTAGCKTFMAVNLDKNIVIVVLTNNATDGDTAGSDLMVALTKALQK
jgi:CubicO group peptidase (beta-lactamase class C family)